jgi:hypothetical protein
MTRRNALLLTLGLAGEGVWAPAWAASAEFWDQKPPADWTTDEIERILTKSPWSKDASITNTAQTGPLGSSRAAVGSRGRMAGRTGGLSPGTTPIPEVTGKWKAGVRWESALPVREAFKRKITKDYSENYVINVFGDIPNAAPSNDDSADERKVKFDILQERTRLERKDDPIDLNRVELAPATPLSPAGTLFYFSRVLAIAPEDKQVTFVTKIGPLELKCKFILKEMIYRGNLEL